jgi:glycerol kinase
MAILPEVVDCAARFGIADRSHLGAAIAVRGIADDQQAAIIGQACFAPGMVTCTHRTGCFALLNTGTQRIASAKRLLTTIAYQLDGVRTYAREGASVAAGAAVQWLRDGLGRIREARGTTALGAGCLAGLHAGLCPPSSELAAGWALERRFEPGLAEDARDAAYAGWRRAVGRTPSAA